MSHRIKSWNFRPYPLLANAHVQTVLGVNLPQRNLPYRATLHRVPLADGDRLALHEDSPAKADDATPIVLLVHGLSGCHLSSYMCRMVEKLNSRDYRVFRLDMRGCGAGEGLARSPTHCGRWEDIATSLNFIAERYCDAPTLLVGFSMGGTQSLNMLAEAGEMRIGNLLRTLVISPPIDLVSLELHFRTFLGRKYDQFFVKHLWQQTRRRWQHFPETSPSEIPVRPRKLRELDELVIAPCGGFASAQDYYKKTSPGPKLTSIRQPVTIVSSQDDPIVPHGPLLEFPHSREVETVFTKQGGHLGFLSKPGEDPDFRWLDWRILEWVEENTTATQQHVPIAGTQPATRELVR